VDARQAAFGAPGDDRPLVTLQTRPGVTAARRGAFGLYHFAILLPDRAALGRFASHLSAHGVRVGMADHLVSEALYLSDPDGLGIEVYIDRPRHTWRHHDRQIAMASDPLDIQSVIAAAGGARWNGAPPGTTMGHVHLHVGSLADAEAFYHRALGLDRGTIPARCSWRPAAITITSARIPGRLAPRRRPIGRSSSSGS